MLSQGIEKSVHHELLKEFATTILNKENVNGNTAKQTLQLYASQDFEKFKEWLRKLTPKTNDRTGKTIKSIYRLTR